MRIFCPATYSSCCQVHRVIYPARHLSLDTPHHDWQTALTDPTGDYEALLVYGAQPLSNFSQFGSLKRKGVKIIWTNDDSYHDWPTWRHDKPSAEVVGCVDLAAEIADLIVSSTPALAEEVGKPEKTVVCPNLLDVPAYRLSTPPADDGPIRILWSGSATHKHDLDLIDSACCRIKEKWKDRVEFYLFGAGPDRLLRDWWGKGVTLTEWIPLRDYWWHLHQARPHLTLCPLTDCHFNRAKSNIRVLEAWAMNSACVASAVGEYKVVRHGEDGLVAETEQCWFSSMDALISDRSLRESLAKTGYRRVTEEWNWSSKQARQKWQPLLTRLDEWDKA